MTKVPLCDREGCENESFTVVTVQGFEEGGKTQRGKPSDVHICDDHLVDFLNVVAARMKGSVKR